MAKTATTKTFDSTTTLGLINDITKTTEALEKLKKKLILAVPAKYGSKLWWEQGEIEAKEDIKAGRSYELKSIDDLDKPLKKLFPNAC